MNIQIYLYKRNFDVQKAERFFKERGIPLQMVDLKKHRLGLRELQLFAQRAGARALVDDSTEARSHPISYSGSDDVILDYLLRYPQFLRTPIVRSGQKVTVGADTAEWEEWLKADHRD